MQRQKIINNSLQDFLKEYKVDSQILVVLTDGMSGAQIQTFLQSLGKFCVINQKKGATISIEDIGKIWLKHTALYISEDDGDFMKALSKLQKNGVSIRTLEAITGIPRSTLSYRFNKEGKSDE